MNRKEKGIAFPTYLSINNIVCHVSLLPADDTELPENDLF
jgi:methionine aminopeptidase